MAENKPKGQLAILNETKTHVFEVPSKRINEAQDVDSWLKSWAYTDIMTFLLQLNAAMFPLRRENGSFEAWALDTALGLSDAVKRLQSLVEELANMLRDAPPNTGPRRFGNASFRVWYRLVEDRLDGLLDKYLPEQVLTAGMSDAPSAVTAKEEVKAYLLGSFGSTQRLDYGTGHELSFLAFLACLWKLGMFGTTLQRSDFGKEERQIVLGVIQPYLELVRKLIMTYTLEPAGSHGVWGLDDHSFVPYVFGSAQLCPPITTPADITQEGSAPDAPRPSDVTKQFVVERERKSNMYFAAIGFIYDVKKGPFWEHSPMLFDISGVTAGWAKINKGMIKMYNVEVLSKFPVVQHFPLGSLLRWERNPNAVVLPSPTQTPSQAQFRPLTIPQSGAPVSGRPVAKKPNPRVPLASTQAHGSNTMPGPANSWTGQSGATGMPATRAPWANAQASLSQAPSTGRIAALPGRSSDRTGLEDTSKPK